MTTLKINQKIICIKYLKLITNEMFNKEDICIITKIDKRDNSVLVNNMCWFNFDANTVKFNVKFDIYRNFWDYFSTNICPY